jgi:hypothetical protein
VAEGLSGRFREERNLLPPPRIEPSFVGRPDRILVTIPTMLTENKKQEHNSETKKER